VVFLPRPDGVPEACELGEQLLNLAQRLPDPALLLAHRAHGQTLCFLGEVAAGRAHLEQAIAVYDLPQHRTLAFHYAQDPAVIAGSWAALASWLLGYPDQALQRSDAAISLARELAHPYSLIYALIWAATIRQFRRERQAASELTETIMALARAQGFALWVAWGTILRGWELSEQGRGTEGITRIREGIAAWRVTGAELFHPHFLTILARAYAEAGRATEGLTTVAEALAIVKRSGERLYEAELHRLQGELLLHQPAGSSQEAERGFRQALDVARSQQAKSLELRAAMSLSRLWQQQGRCAEARELLAPIYGWFTEGFDTADLQEAKALLDEVS
jgi:predicted ATPase